MKVTKLIVFSLMFTGMGLSYAAAHRNLPPLPDSPMTTPVLGGAADAYSTGPLSFEQMEDLFGEHRAAAAPAVPAVPVVINHGMLPSLEAQDPFGGLDFDAEGLAEYQRQDAARLAAREAQEDLDRNWADFAKSLGDSAWVEELEGPAVPALSAEEQLSREEALRLEQLRAIYAAQMFSDDYLSPDLTEEEFFLVNPDQRADAGSGLTDHDIYQMYVDARQGEDLYSDVRNTYTLPTLLMPSANNSEDLQGSGLFADEDVFGDSPESAVAPRVADRLSVTDLQNLVRLEAYLIGTDKLDYAGVLNNFLATKAMLARPDISGLAGVDLAANNGDVSGGDDLGGKLLVVETQLAAAKEALGDDYGSEEEGEDDQEDEQPVDTSKIAALLAAGNLVNIEELLISDLGYVYAELLRHDLARKRRILENEIQASSGLAAAGDSGSYLEPNKQIKDTFSFKPVGNFNSGDNPIFIRRPAAAKEAPSGQ